MKLRLAVVTAGAAVVLLSGLAMSSRVSGGSAQAHAGMSALHATASATAARGATNGRSAGPGATPQASPTPARTGSSTHGVNATPPWFTVRVAAACVVPGGTQTLIVQSRPGYVVAYNTTYSDGRHGDVDGGEGYSPTNADGSYRSAFTVAPTAAAGTVTVVAGTQRGTEPPVTARSTFTVAAHC